MAMLERAHFSWVGPDCPALERSQDEEFHRRSQAVAIWAPTDSMTWYLLLILLVVWVAAAILWDWQRSGRLFCGPLPRPFRDRESQEAAWQQACGDDALKKADALLAMLCEAFSFNPDNRYQVAPDDRIMDIYRACYPRWQFWKLADSMEIETLLMDLSRRFHLDDEELCDVTFGEIVELMKSRPQTEQERR